MYFCFNCYLIGTIAYGDDIAIIRVVIENLKNVLRKIMKKASKSRLYINAIVQKSKSESFNFKAVGNFSMGVITVNVNEHKQKFYKKIWTGKRKSKISIYWTTIIPTMQ